MILIDQAIEQQIQKAQADLAGRSDLPSWSYRFRTGLDSTGDPAVWIWVILRRGTPVEQAAFERLQVIAEQIRSNVLEASTGGSLPYLGPPFGPPLWPYVNFQREEEQP